MVIQPDRACVNGGASGFAADATARCGYIAGERWRHDPLGPFCDAPAVSGGSYCARHHALCTASAASAAGRALAAALQEAVDDAPEPPPELAHLMAAALPEPVPEDERDLLVLLDHPPPRHHDDEGEDE